MMKDVCWEKLPGRRGDINRFRAIAKEIAGGADL